jgi:hypothetical protein
MTEAEIQKLYTWACNKEGHGETHYAGMTYEDGIKAVLDILEGEGTVDDLINDLVDD